MNLRGWVAVAESPHWFAWPNGPTAKKGSAALQQECKKGGGAFFRRRGVYLASKELFHQGERLFLQQGRKVAIKGPLFCQWLMSRWKYQFSYDH